MPEQSELLKKPEDLLVPLPKYTDQQKLYLKSLQARLTKARDARDSARDEFDGMSYVRYTEENRKLANSYIKPRQNREDTNYQSGTIRQKMFSILAAVNNLDLTPDINVFNKDDVEMTGFAQALEDIIWKTEELDNDEEKKLNRQYVLMEQGTVFVNEDWIEKVGVKKNLNKAFDGKEADWTTRLEKVFEGASRDIIQNEKVFLGDITQFEMKEQPCVFTVEVLPYEVARQIYGQWDMWQFVDRRRKRFIDLQGEHSLYNANWLVTQVEDGQVEIVKYQDKPNNEFQIIINSVPMLPIGFPMPWKHGEYSLVKQVYSIISPHFAYGKSFPSVTRLQVAVWDEMLRLMVLKTQKSFKPPLGNLTGKVVSQRILMPGVISHGIDPDRLKLMDPEGSKGLNSAEASALQIIRDNIDQLTVNPTFTGQNPQGGVTATQIIEVQRQARLVLGLSIFVAAQLEKKLGELRLMNVLEHWFDPIDEVVDSVKNALKDKFRSFTRKMPIEGEGMGQRITRVTKEGKNKFDLMKEEEEVTKKSGVTTRITELNPDVVRSSKYHFYVAVVPREKRTSPTSKLMFREMLADVQLFDRPAQGLGVDWAYLSSRFAHNWEENPEKLFTHNEQQPGMSPLTPPLPEGQGTKVQPVRGVDNPASRPRVNLNVGAIS